MQAFSAPFWEYATLEFWEFRVVKTPILGKKLIAKLAQLGKIIACKLFKTVFLIFQRSR